MATSRKTADEKVAEKTDSEETKTKAAEQHEDQKDGRSAADLKASEEEAKENRRASAERAAAVAAPSGEAALPLDEDAVFQPPTPQPDTHVDKDGVRRITSGTDKDGWAPAPVDPHPEQVARAKERNAQWDEEAQAEEDARRKASRASEDN